MLTAAHCVLLPPHQNLVTTGCVVPTTKGGPNRHVKPINVEIEAQNGDTIVVSSPDNIHFYGEKGCDPWNNTHNEKYNHDPRDGMGKFN